MRMLKLINVMFTIGLLTPTGLFRLLSGLFRYGINLMTLLYVAGKSYPNQVALVDENETLDYGELWSRSHRLSFVLHQNYHIQSGQKVGFLCKNHASLVESIFAVSRLGADLYLLNVEMSQTQFDTLLDRYDFDLFIYDEECGSFLEQAGYTKAKVLSYHDQLTAINNLHQLNLSNTITLPRTSLSKLALLTGGTTGQFKVAAHQPSLFNYLNPFLALFTKLRLFKYQTAYIATPIYHGYGIAILLLLLTLGKKMVICRGFDASRACRLVREHQVEVITVVPLMIDKMIKHHAEDLRSLACIASGGAELSAKLVQQVFHQVGDVLYNLYGTSEAGLNIIATPQDLRYSDRTLGRKIRGVRLNILDYQKQEVGVGKIGQFCIQNEWSMRNRAHSWIETGDLGYQDARGYYFWCGRKDDMVISAGENVYPIEVEQVLLGHPQVEDVAVIGVSDEMFGQRLQAYVVVQKEGYLTEEELAAWLRPRVARYQVPREITFVEQLPFTSLGKRDRKKLKKS